MPVGIEEIDLRITSWRVQLNLHFERVVVRMTFVEARGMKFFNSITETIYAQRNMTFEDLHRFRLPPGWIGHTNDVKFLAVG